jgi:hypothetical protein
LIDLENVQPIISIETLIQLLRKKVGSPVSYSSLAEDLQCSDKTIKRWLAILETLYVVFKVPPFHRNISRSILKAPKYYFYETGQIIDEPGITIGAVLLVNQFPAKKIEKRVRRPRLLYPLMLWLEMRFGDLVTQQ